MARDVTTIIDSLNFFVESRNIGNVFNAVATATGGLASPDIVNTQQRGLMLFITVASITVSAATLAVNINAKDVSAGTYFPYVRVSLDGLTASSSLQYIEMLYVGAASTAVVGGGGGQAAMNASVPGNAVIWDLPVPGTYQITSSLTITNTSATNSGTVGYRIDAAAVM